MNNLFDIAPVVSQKSNEWYTPAKYVDAARKVMGGIDLDPASCKEANEIVKATRYYTKHDNGLEQQWNGNVWLNPPYTASNRINPMGPWSRKLMCEYRQGNVPQSVMLILGATYNKWFQPLWDYCICFVDHKIQFMRPGKRRTEELYLRDMTVFVYLGPNEAAFIEHFSPFGRIAKAIDTPKARVAPLSLWEVSV